MAFKKGRMKTGGRQRGTPNKVTGTFREAVRTVYEGLGGHAAFLAWAKKNPDEFYRLAARLIPTEVAEEDQGGTVTIIVQQFTNPSLNGQRFLPAKGGDGTAFGGAEC